MSTLQLRIVGHTLPGRRFSCYEPVYVGVQRGRDVVQLAAGDASEAVFELTVDAAPRPEGDLDFRGPFVHGARGDRFLYLSWGTLGAGGEFTMFRRAKIRFSEIPAALLEHALLTGETLDAGLRLTGDRGGPLCAAVRPPQIRWQCRGAARA